ncbi:urease subunit beta [Halalkalibacter alkalisediminis]|uniref:Urease subunit beta n=1 Tax=Halalkalibacter alkalisediminis TaxID=935616 RepID=A0ABV6NJZ5_9BACI|nr:urease subunit beta [Halalkalibacter alkalisediminis]
MIPGEIRVAKGSIHCNQNRKTLKIKVSNIGDRPIQVGSHFHFIEVNRFLAFDRVAAIGMRLNIAAGTAVRFEPGEEKEVELVEVGGNRVIHGLNGLTNGSIDSRKAIEWTLKEKGFSGGEN